MPGRSPRRWLFKGKRIWERGEWLRCREFRTLLFLEKWPNGGRLLSGALGGEQTGVEFEIPEVSGIGI